MKSIVKHLYNNLFIILCLLSLIVSCGHKKSPTGGKRDLVKPEILYIDPPEFSELSDKAIEIMFSKPIDRKSINTGIYFYPPILKKRYNWDKDLLKISVLEELDIDRNYFLSISSSIEGEHGNNLDQDYVHIFKHGELQTNRISGKISYEKLEDQDDSITLKLFSADTTLIMRKEISGNIYELEHLNPQDHILIAYQDKNTNNRYDYETEPYFEKRVAGKQFTNLDFTLSYQDTINPGLKSAEVNSKNQIKLRFTEEISEFEKIEITSADSMAIPLDLTASYLEKDEIELITTDMDTVKYMVSVVQFQDIKGNSTAQEVIYIKGISDSDNVIPTIDYHYPRNGATVNELMPEIGVKFSEIIFVANIQVKLTAVETKTEISLDLIAGNSRLYRFLPRQELANYASYNFYLLAEDQNGNKLQKPLDFSFIPIVRE